MIIAQSSLQFASAHTSITTLNIKENISIWVDQPRSAEPEDRLTISAPTAAPAQKETEEPGNHGAIDPKLLLFVRLLEALTGKKIKIADLSDIGEPPAEAADLSAFRDPNQTQQPPQPPREGWGMTYSRNETRTEQEQVAIQASGTVTTADGRSFEISLNVQMSRQFLSQENLTIREGDAKRIDPLVINLDGAPASLSNVRFSFDLNADGEKEDVPFVSNGNGLLALDRNNDGKILDGSELFGPATGNGFAELARYDEDNSGWIDENDRIFRQLSVWTKDAAGNDQYQNLKDAGIGAIALAGVRAEYSFKDQQNNLLGALRQSGLYLRENGSAGSIHQIDLAI